MPARVYIDGLNLYYRALKNTAHKWLDIAALADAVMPAGAIRARSSAKLLKHRHITGINDISINDG